MVVRFPAEDAAARPGRRSESLAPVAYLPGARPGAAAEAALARVHETAAAPDLAGNEPAGHTAKQRARATNVSIHQLARRGMSRWELEQVLRKREVDDVTAAAELDRLESVGLLDDAALALSVVYTEHARKGRGRQAIAHELRRRHIDQGIIDDALAEVDDDDELERARELAVKRVRQLTSVDDETARRRLTGFLARKGYPGDVVQKAVTDALAAREHPVRFR